MKKKGSPKISEWGDVLYYGDNHSAVLQLHCREDVEKLIEAGNKLIVLDVGLKHCGPCVKVYPTVVFARMNGDENDSCMQFLKDMECLRCLLFGSSEMVRFVEGTWVLAKENLLEKSLDTKEFVLPRRACTKLIVERTQTG